MQMVQNEIIPKKPILLFVRWNVTECIVDIAPNCTKNDQRLTAVKNLNATRQLNILLYIIIIIIYVKLPVDLLLTIHQ